MPPEASATIKLIRPMEGWAAEAKPNSASVCHGPDAGVGLSASRSGQGFNGKNLLRHGSWRDRGNLQLQLQLHCSSQPTNTFAAGKIGFVGWSPPSPLLNPYRRQGERRALGASEIYAELVGGADPVVCPSRQPYRSSALRKAADHVACRQTAALSKWLSRCVVTPFMQCPQYAHALVRMTFVPPMTSLFL